MSVAVKIAMEQGLVASPNREPEPKPEEANRECGKFAIVGTYRDKKFDVQVSGEVWTSTIGTLELARQHLKESTCPCGEDFGEEGEKE